MVRDGKSPRLVTCLSQSQAMDHTEGTKNTTKYSLSFQRTYSLGPANYKTVFILKNQSNTQSLRKKAGSACEFLGQQKATEVVDFCLEQGLGRKVSRNFLRAPAGWRGRRGVDGANVEENKQLNKHRVELCVSYVPSQVPCQKLASLYLFLHGLR